MKKLKLIIIQGIAGSGKSTIALELKEQYDAVIISSDEIRKELIDTYIGSKNDYYHMNEVPFDLIKQTGDRNRIEKQVWDIFKERVSFRINMMEENVILDATFISKWTRKEFIDTYKDVCQVIGYSIEVPLDVAFERNQKRTRKVPNIIITTMFQSFEPFTLSEGFEHIIRRND